MAVILSLFFVLLAKLNEREANRIFGLFKISAVMIVMYVLPIAGWLVTLIAMKTCKLDREAMIDVQKRIAAKKEELKSEN